MCVYNSILHEENIYGAPRNPIPNFCGKKIFLVIWKKNEVLIGKFSFFFILFIL